MLPEDDRQYAVLPEDDMQYAVETCRSNKSVLKQMILN